ncbi:hypothetical protein GCM10020255_010950 [Rhodococcus baikonurensis]
MELIARSGFDGHRFAGDRGQVQAGGAGGDGAVGGGAFTGAHEHAVTDGQLVRFDRDFAAAAQDGDGRRHQREERSQAAPGFGHGIVFEAFSDGEQDPEHRGFVDLAERDRADRGDRHQGSDADAAVAQIHRGIRYEGRCRDDRGDESYGGAGGGASDQPGDRQ